MSSPAAVRLVPGVQGVCDGSFKRSGSNVATVYLGPVDAWRNLEMLPHELGHALGFADHGEEPGKVNGHLGFKPCGNYIGVMSYCTSSQSWFMDGNIKGLLLDGDLIRDYWHP